MLLQELGFENNILQQMGQHNDPAIEGKDKMYSGRHVTKVLTKDAVMAEVSENTGGE